MPSRPHTIFVATSFWAPLAGRLIRAPQHSQSRARFLGSITTLAHVKSFLSGVFRSARRQGILNSENPIRDVVLPKARPSGETYAYSLDEILQMLQVLPEPASTIVAVAGFTGLREGELRGLLWENYDEKQLTITRSVWRSHVLNPKTKASMAPVPVIAQLREKLDNHRMLTGNPQSGPIFANGVGNPTSLAKIAHDVIRPTLEKTNLTWHGWHAFRRGLATNPLPTRYSTIGQGHYGDAQRDRQSLCS